MINIYIREYRPAEEENHVSVERGRHLWMDTFYDADKQIIFHVMQEPEWVHMEKDTTYEIEFDGPDDDDCYHYRVWERLAPHIVLVAQYYGDHFEKINSRHIDLSSVRGVSVENYISSFKESADEYKKA